MAQQQQWTTEFTDPSSGVRVVETDMWNAGRMSSRSQEIGTNGSTVDDYTESFALPEVAFGDPVAFTGGGPTVLAWQVSVQCRQGFGNGGKCIVQSDNLNGNGPTGPAVQGDTAIMFPTKDAATAFVSFFRK
jgi:hypothetical protein